MGALNKKTNKDTCIRLKNVYLKLAVWTDSLLRFSSLPAFPRRVVHIGLGSYLLVDIFLIVVHVSVNVRRNGLELNLRQSPV